MTLIHLSLLRRPWNGFSCCANVLAGCRRKLCVYAWILGGPRNAEAGILSLSRLGPFEKPPALTSLPAAPGKYAEWWPAGVLDPGDRQGVWMGEWMGAPVTSVTLAILYMAKMDIRVQMNVCQLNNISRVFLCRRVSPSQTVTSSALRRCGINSTRQYPKARCVNILISGPRLRNL